MDVSANLHTAVSGGTSTFFSLTPGIRFGVGNRWVCPQRPWPSPMVGPLPFHTNAIFQVIKNF